MEKRINIAELLKDCPSGMKLDCTMFDGLELDHIDVKSQYPIKCRVKHHNGGYNIYTFTEHGHWNYYLNSKCVIFPKGKTTWDGFQIPFKDGDILATDLGSVFYLNTRLNNDECYGCYVGIDGDGSFHICEPFAYKECCGLATEEEKQKLFDAIKAYGYKWNEETKTLDKLQMFKVGNRIKNKRNCIATIIKFKDDYYYYKDENGYGMFHISGQNQWELVSDKFDINILVSFDSRVLVREKKTDVWEPSFYGFFNQHNKRFYTPSGGTWRMCIPYNEDTKHLTGTTKDCDEYYKTW